MREAQGPLLVQLPSSPGESALGDVRMAGAGISPDQGHKQLIREKLDPPGIKDLQGFRGKLQLLQSSSHRMQPPRFLETSSRTHRPTTHTHTHCALLGSDVDSTGESVITRVRAQRLMLLLASHQTHRSLSLPICPMGAAAPPRPQLVGRRQKK